MSGNEYKLQYSFHPLKKLLLFVFVKYIFTDSTNKLNLHLYNYFEHIAESFQVKK